MVLNNKLLKKYQENLLNVYSSYLSRCRELKDPAAAFIESTKKSALGIAQPYYPLPELDHVPYVCLRVPTGGGKTRIAGQSIKCVNEAFLATEHSLVLWLVPSDPIREQTLYALKTQGELLYQDMRDLFGAVNVLDINEALYMQPATLNTGNTIIVATMQSFKRDTADGLRVYRQNGALMSHFEDVSTEQKGDHSLVDVIRLRRPYVIVDEAHNQGTQLAVDTLKRFNPSCILELTATPDRACQPSNVLRSVSAATLQAEDMLKLPLELAIHPEWRVSLTEAIARLRQLEKDAEQEKQLTGEMIQPVVMLIQAERIAKEKETFTPEKVKQHLIDDFNIQPETIAIATGAVDELSGKKLGDPDYPQFIITVDKLREGWDCPNAYILFSFRNTTSATAVEQVLGRVLRMPNVTRKQCEALNRSYAYVVSNELASTVQNLKDGLVQSGFERLEAKDLIVTPDNDKPQQDLFAPTTDLTIPLPEYDDVMSLPDEEAVASLPKAIREKIEISPETGTLTVKNGATNKQLQQISETFKQPEVAKAVKEKLDTALAIQAAPPARELTPAEKGVSFNIPLLGYKQRSFFDVFDETPLLDAEWEISDFDYKLKDSEFSPDVEAMRRASLSISQLEKVECDVYDRLDSQLALFGKEQGWLVTDLIYWLDRNLYFPYSERDIKVAWLNAALSYLMDDKGFSLDELAYRKFRLRGALQRKMAAGLVEAKQRVFDDLFSDENKFEVRDEHSITFEQGRYGYDSIYTGLIHLKKHFFPVIGNLKSTGEEFECAEFIAHQMEGVEWWVRNVEKKPTSFWLQTASDKFYPDFVVKLTSGVVLAIEYKGQHLSAEKGNRDSIEKQRIGELWAKRSNGTCGFVWVENRNWQALNEAAKKFGCS
ncbi:restriction endonuclease subunit R [Vibrio cholerae]|uniref:DEAD/DEAH box helicase n=1 Tax=Vibrio cholerae TaxID=666 RepID=UPI002DBE92AD|nr:DEAD/DEAH box helicase family protein [Vibrio cholerae]MEB5554461.1 restriction endonuclease subunit R [Vibrio cholerae]